MNRSQIVFTNYPYHKFTLKSTLDSLQRLHAQKLEFVACEPHFYVGDADAAEAAALKADLRARGMELVCLTAPCNEYPINIASKNPVTRMRSIDYIVKHIQYANFFEAPTVQFVAGEATLNEDRAEVAKRAAEALHYLADIADGYGVKLLNSYADSKFISAFGSAEELHSMQQSIHPGAFLGMTDTVYMTRCGETVKDIMEVFGSKLYMVEVADAKSSPMHLAVGEGELKLDAIIADFETAGYKGYYSLNMRGAREPYLYEEEPEKCMKISADYMLAKL